MEKYQYKLYGAILGDLCGQPYERGIRVNDKILLHNPESVITDDTLMTLASARSMIENIPAEWAYKEMGKKYPVDSYGSSFKTWIEAPVGTINNSWGNGCLMRVSPFMYGRNNLNAILDSVLCSHHHHLSVKACVDLYNAYNSLDLFTNKPVKPFKNFEVRADVTANFCINFVHWYTNVQRAIVECVKCGGDTDTNASIVGELCNFRYKGITEKDAQYVESKLDTYQLNILKTFNTLF